MNKEKGQVFPLTALMLVVLIGAAALAIDVSMAHNQQRRQQQDLDTVTKLAATGYTYSQALNFLKARGYDVSDTSKFVLQAPSSGPYAGKPSCLASTAGEGCYVEGYLKQNLRSFFGNVLGFHWMKVSVHAAAEKGGSYVEPPALLALDTDPNNCGVKIQGGSGTGAQIIGNVHADSQTCVKAADGNVTVTGSVVSDVTTGSSNGGSIPGTVNGTSGNGTGSYMANPYAPGAFSDLGSPLTTTPYITPSIVSDMTVCGNIPVHKGDTIYQPRTNTGVAVLPAGMSISSGDYDLLPYCDSSGNKTAGIYFLGNNLQISCGGGLLSSCPVVNVYDSTFVFNYATGAGIQWTGGTLNMEGPTSGPFCAPTGQACSSIAMWQWHTPNPCTSASAIKMKFAGQASGSIQGIVDLQCANLTVLGNSSNPSFVQGSIIAWDLIIGGSGGGIATIDPGFTPPLPRGAVLVQ
jgi:Putative Flp pilus-assembly TadE/G-like